MLLCAVCDWAYSGDAWPIFVLLGTIVVIVGGTFSIFNEFQPEENSIESKEGLLLVVVVWIVFPLLSALPFVGLGFSFTDSMFESVSGLTTTGATVVTGLDTTSVGLLLWRAILQWIGGLSIIVTAIIVLPSLGVGGMEVFHFDSTESSGKFTKNSGRIARILTGIYLAVSVLCMLMYWSYGMSFFDAVAHAMTTVSAGGFSTTDASFLQQNDQILLVAIVFMILVGLPFLVFVPLSELIVDLAKQLKDFVNREIQSLKSRSKIKTEQKRQSTEGKHNPSKSSKYRQRKNDRKNLSRQLAKFWKDTYSEVSKSQIPTYLAVILISILVIASFGQFQEVMNSDLSTKLLHTVFSVASVLTGTGYASIDYNAWGAGVVAWFIVLMICGGCAGSATCGMKIFRLQIAASAVSSYCKKMVSPHLVSHISYNGKKTEPGTLQGIMVFIFLYIVTFLVSASLLALSGLDPVTAISAAAASVSNVGPGFGEIIGPTGTFQPLSDYEKWICLVTMLLGRLEFTAFFVVLTPRFWTS